MVEGVVISGRSEVKSGGSERGGRQRLVSGGLVASKSRKCAAKSIGEEEDSGAFNSRHDCPHQNGWAPSLSPWPTDCESTLDSLSVPALLTQDELRCPSTMSLM